MTPKPLPDDGPHIKSALVTLIVVRNGLIEFAYNVGDKRDLMAGFDETTDALYAVWTGNYYGHLFTVEAARVLEQLR